MRTTWTMGAALALGIGAGSAEAQDVVWRPAAPVASLGRPAPVGEGVSRVEFRAAPPKVIARAQSGDVPPPVPPPISTTPPPAYVPPPPPGVAPAPPPGYELYNHGAVTQPPGSGTGFWDQCKNLFDLQSGPMCGSGCRAVFQSDHAFDRFISPVSNPFYFEDPRSLTELRPIFMYQTIPNKNYALQGGNTEFFGFQARLALTERLSIVMNKLGGVWLNPGDTAIPPFTTDESGFAELNIGPKYTIIRNESSGTAGALGLTFQIPAGGSNVFQDTGAGSLVPYFTIAQSFGRSSYGSFNVMGTIGYNFSMDDKRTDNFFTSLHLDYDVANLHKIYPLIELNWTQFTSNGSTSVQTFEGGDLYNFGATEVSGNNTLTLATGLRYKFNENIQFGTAVEFPVVGRKDMMDFRLTVDLIFRY